LQIDKTHTHVGMIRKNLRLLRWLAKSIQIKFLKGDKEKWINRDLKSTQAYWENRNDPNNKFLYDNLQKFQFNSLCEIGSNCGNKLYQMAKEFSQIKFTGIEINKVAVEFGKTRFRELGINNVQLFQGEASNLGRFADESFDVVFSWATLIYVPPDEIDIVLTEMIRIARKALILIEMHDGSLTNKKKIRGVLVPPGNWKRNYNLILQEKGIDSSLIHIEDVPQKVWNPGGGFAKIITIAPPDSKTLLNQITLNSTH